MQDIMEIFVEIKAMRALSSPHPAQRDDYPIIALAPPSARFIKNSLSPRSAVPSMRTSWCRAVSLAAQLRTRQPVPQWLNSDYLRDPR